MESKAVQLWLGRLLDGACLPGDVHRLARQAGFPTFAELCSARLPERLPRLRIQPRSIRSHIDRALEGEFPLAELRAWADELHAIAFRHVIGKDRAERRRAVEALALVATAADEAIFKSREPGEQVLRAISASLADGLPIVPADLYGRLFLGQRELHLAARRPLVVVSDDGFTDGDLSWADVVLRAEPGRASSGDPTAVVAFAVVTERAASTDDPGHGTPVPGALLEARRLVPNFAFGRYRPRLRRDVDGITEFVLRTAEIDDEALAYAAKLFAIVNRIGSLTLDGKRVPTLRF